MMEMSKKEILLSVLAQHDEKTLRGFTDQIADAYKEIIEHCRPLLARRNSLGATVGIVIALRQLANNITEQTGNMNIPLFDEMVELFNEGLKLGSVAWTSTVDKEDPDEEQ